MDDTEQRIEGAVQMLERDTQLTHDIVHGNETRVVQTEGGPVPSHKKVATDGYQYFVNELRPRVNEINEHTKLVIDSANEANTASKEAVKAKKDAVKVVYDGGASLDPAPGKIPIADSSAKLHPDWLPYQTAPFPDFWLPLNDSLDMLAGISDTAEKKATFTRTTTATYLDKSGVLRKAIVNAPRFEREGILIEGVSTNLLGKSNTHDVLDPQGDGAPVTPGGGFGEFKSVILTWNGKGTGWLTSYRPTYKMNTTYTVSFWARTRGNTDVMPIHFQLGSPIPAGSTYINVDKKEWTRYSMTVTTQSTNDLITRFYRGSPSANGDSIEVACLQIEELPFVSSYIPTTNSAVTRAGESITVNSSLNLPAPNANVTFAMDVNELSIVNGQFINMNAYNKFFTCGTVGGSGETVRGSRSPSGKFTFRWYQDPETFYGDTTFNKSQHRFVFVSTGFNDCRIYEDAVLVHQAKKTTPFGMYNTPLRIGNLSSGYLWGHIKNFRIWHETLTYSQIATL